MPDTNQTPKIAINRNLALILDPQGRYVTAISDGNHTLALKYPRPTYLARQAIADSAPETIGHAMLTLLLIPKVPYRSAFKRFVLPTLAAAAVGLCVGLALQGVSHFLKPHAAPPPQKQIDLTKTVRA